MAVYILFVCQPIWAQETGLSGIVHLELGAANYQAQDEGRPNYPKRWHILEKTFERLIEKYGPSGKIYLNDLDQTGLEEVVEFSKKWLAERGYDRIEIVELVGDYNLIQLPSRVKTAHLSHPAPGQLTGFGYETVDYLGISNWGKHTVRTYIRIAQGSETGLKITTLYTAKPMNLIPRLREIVTQYGNDEIKLVETGKIGLGYYDDLGTAGKKSQLSNRNTRVFYIKSTAPSCRLSL